MSGLGSIRDLLRDHGLDGVPEEPFPNDGWSGARLTRLRNETGRAFILKRSSYDRDWIAQATHDEAMREAVVAELAEALPWPVRYPALGAVRDDREIAILMPDLSGSLLDWNAPLPVARLDRVLHALAVLHGDPADAFGEMEAFTGERIWTGWEDRLTLICRASLERPGAARDAVADRLLPGWDLWDRLARPAARELVDALSHDIDPLLAALGRQPVGLIHGDLKLANVGLAADGAVDIVDWQMATIAPASIEMGWFLVANVNALPLPPDAVLERYWAFRGRDPGHEDDLAVLVGLLLRGWRKGFDAEAGITLASGVSAADDLAWWCERAIEAADRLL